MEQPQSICPMQTNEATMQSQKEHVAHWRDDSTCSYCGSLHPDKLFEAIANGKKLIPTDKTYKIYVMRDDPNVGQQRIVACASGSSHPGGAGDWVQVTDENRDSLPLEEFHKEFTKNGGWVMLGDTPAEKMEKFYFSHLSGAEKQKFVDLYNTNKLRLDGPFYIWPFFMTPLKSSEIN